jgi:hypothetical protein
MLAPCTPFHVGRIDGLNFLCFAINILVSNSSASIGGATNYIDRVLSWEFMICFPVCHAGVFRLVRGSSLVRMRWTKYRAAYLA